MPEYERLRPRDAHERAFRALLLLYPRAFRDACGDAMVEFFRDRLADERAAHGALGALAIWGRAITDTLYHAPLTRLDALRRAMAHAFAPPPRAARAARREDWMLSSLWQDARIAVRGMRRTPALSLMIIVTLALGLGANAAIFSMVYAVQLRPLPFPQADRLVQVAMQEPAAEHVGRGIRRRAPGYEDDVVGGGLHQRIHHPLRERRRSRTYRLAPGSPRDSSTSSTCAPRSGASSRPTRSASEGRTWPY